MNNWLLAGYPNQLGSSSAKTLLTAEDGRFLPAPSNVIECRPTADGLEQLPSNDVADSLTALCDLKSDGPNSDATKLG